MIFSVPTIFYKNRTIIHECELEITDYSVTAICGKNGCGKTLLINSLFSYCIDNDIPACMMDQSSDMILNHCSVLENIAMSSEKKDLAYAMELLKKYELEHLVNHAVNELSGGERRMLCLLRCLCKGAEYFFFDEPTNDLDYLMVNKVISVINDLAKKSTVIIVSHDDRIISKVDESYIIKDQKIIISKKSCLSERNRQYIDAKESYKNSNTLETVLAKSISFLSVPRILLVLFSVCILYFCFLYQVSTNKKSKEWKLAPNEVDIFIPLSDYANVALSEGAIPIRALGCFNENLGLSEKVKLYNQLFQTEESMPINFGLSLPEDEKWLQYECEFYNLKDRSIVYPLEIYSEKYENGSSIDTSSYFYAFFDDTAENSVPIDMELYLQTTKDLKEEFYNTQFECTWIVVCLQDIDFYDFINSKQVTELLGGNYFIISAETIELSTQINSFLVLKQHLIRCGIACIIFVLIAFFVSIINGFYSVVPIRVFRNCGVRIEDLIVPIHRCTGDIIFFAVCFITTNILLVGILIKFDTAYLVSSYIGNLFYILACAISRWIQIKSSDVFIVRAYNWRIRQ